MSDIFGSPAKTAKSDQTNSRSTSASDSNSLTNSFNNSNSVSNSANTSNSTSGNQAYPYLQGALSGQVGQGGSANNALASLLGVGGDPSAQQSAFNDWKNSTGYQFGLNQGLDGITTNNAAKGLLNSGATLKAMDMYGQNYANTQFQNYLNPLQSLISNGSQAAGTIGSAGNVSNSTSNGFSNSLANSTGGANSVSNATSRGDTTSSGISLEDSRGANSGQGGQMLGQVLSMFAGGK